MKIQILKVNGPTTAQGKRGAYFVLEVNYTSNGKVAAKKINSYAGSVFDTLKNAKPDDAFEVVVEKDGQYTNWTAIQPAPADVPSASADAGGPKATTYKGSTYETPEERKENRTRIVRQSCIGYAISTLKTEKTVPAFDEILSLAAKYEAWVIRPEHEDPMKAIMEMDDDIPV